LIRQKEALMYFREKTWLLFFLLPLALFISACGHSSDSTAGSSSEFIPGELINSPVPTPLTSFAQTLANNDTDTGNSSYDLFPGQANVWDISNEFELEDGNDDQFDNALQLTVGATSFPAQTYDELTFYTPYMDDTQGVKTAAVSDGSTLYSMSPIAGSYSAFLAPTSNSRLQQTVDLRSATVPIDVEWSHNAELYGGNIATYTPSYRVVIRDTDGNELAELYSTNADTGLQSHSYSLNAYEGQIIVLSFESANTPEDWDSNVVEIDSVRVWDSVTNQFLTNGDFESGDLTGWTTNTPQEVQNMTSGVRTLEGLDVTRSFYTVPNSLWGRWVDVFTNNTGSDITKTITYYTNLGSDDSGIIYYTPGTSNHALTSWDGACYDRDIGLVFGTATSVDFTSDDDLGNGNGDDSIYVTYDITVPAGGKAAIVNFVIMSGTDTCQTASDISARATEVDTAAAEIVNHFWTDGQYRTGMTQEQVDAIKNF
jgi:hypothetical protein